MGARNAHPLGFTQYICNVLLNLSVLGLCVRINDSGLFAWISLTALSRLCVRINDSGLFAWIRTMCTD